MDIASGEESMIHFTRAHGMLLAPYLRETFDLSQVSEETNDACGGTRVEQSVLLARLLVKTECRFVTTSRYKHGQWDTHGDNEMRLRSILVPHLEKSLSALMEDLKQRGLLEVTVALVTGEFGRTPAINPKRGRDLWLDYWSLVVDEGVIQGG